MPARVAVPASLAAVLACWAPAQATAQWEPPLTISEPVAFADAPRLAAAGDRRVLVTWGFRQPSGMFGTIAVSRRPDGRWGPQRAWGVALAAAGPAPRRAGVGEGLSSIAPYGRDRWLGLAVRADGRRQVLEWWRGTTAGGLRRGGALTPEPWEAGGIAARPDGSAVAAWTTMPPRRGAGSVLRPRVVVLARQVADGRVFGAARRVSPLPPPPPYGRGRGPALSATAVAVASGGRRTVAVAWRRAGRLEARISRDGGRTFGPVRRAGPSPDAFPRIAVRVSGGGDVVLAWGARERRAGGRQVLVVRAARTPSARTGDAGVHFSTELRPVLLERTAPIDVPSPVADQFGPATHVAFSRGRPVVAWQGADAGRVVVRLAALDAAGTTRTLQDPGGAAVLDDLLVDDGRVAVAWHAVDALGTPGAGHVATGPAGGGPLTQEVLPGPAAVIAVRLAPVPQGLLAAWSVRTAPPGAVLASVRAGGF